MRYIGLMSSHRSVAPLTQAPVHRTYASHVAALNDGQRSTSEGSAAAELPNVGEIIHRLRVQRGLSLQDAADATGLSPSFLSAVERGKSDIALKRLARVAQFLGHDIGSLLGYTARRARPMFVDQSQRIIVDRGRDVDYEVIRLPGLGFELVAATFAPGAGLRDEISHEGVDIVYVTQGDLTLVYNGERYVMPVGSCSIYSGGYAHSFSNETEAPASMVAVVTETVY